MKSNLISIDIWFLYGSFCYGAEAELLSVNGDSLVVSLIPKDEEEAEYLKDFTKELVSFSKGIIKTEVRVYSGEESEYVTIVSEYPPAINASLANSLKIYGIRFVKPNDEERFRVLCREYFK